MVRVTFDSFEEAQRQMFGFGADVYVLEPEMLRTRLIDMATELLSAYSTEAKPAI